MARIQLNFFIKQMETKIYKNMNPLLAFSILLNLLSIGSLAVYHFSYKKDSNKVTVEDITKPIKAGKPLSTYGRIVVIKFDSKHFFMPGERISIVRKGGGVEAVYESPSISDAEAYGHEFIKLSDSAVQKLIEKGGDIYTSTSK